MNKICTTIEQSKKLIELGLDVNTADMYFEPSTGFCTEPSEVRVGDIKYAHPRSIPAWSIAALLGLMPNFTLNGFGNGQFNCRDERADCYALVDTCPLDAAFQMVVWLKENGKI